MAELPEGLVLQVDDPAILEDPEVKALLQQSIDSLDHNPLQKYWPHPKQKAFHWARTKIKVFMGGNRSGKTTAGAIDDVIQAVDEDVLPEHLKAYKIWQPPFKCRIITPDYGRSFQSVIEVLQQWIPTSQYLGGSWETAFKDKDHILRFANGSFFEFMTLEQEVNKFGGSARHRIHYDEEPKGEKGEEIRNECAMRLVDYRGDELFTFSPVNGLSWTYDELFEKKGPEVEKQVWLDDVMVLVQADQDDNPHIDQQGKEEALEKLPEAQREARKSGNYTHWKGLVYPDFTPELHVVDQEKVTPEIVSKLTQIDGIDPGQGTTAILFAGFFEKNNCVLVFDELYLHGNGAIPENAAERIFDIRNHWDLPQRPKYCVIDPAASSRDLASGERVDQAYRRAGVKCIHAQNEVEAGVFEVMRRLEYKADDGEGDRKPEPLLLVSSRCVQLLKEIGKYRLDPKQDGSFGVVKKNDHGCDVMRYICMARPLAPARRKQRRRVAAQRWTPGTAPPFTPSRPRVGGPMGKFT